MNTARCSNPRCIHHPSSFIACGYDETMALESVGPGWSDIVREALAVVEGRGRLVQVKEKFGGLRLYADSNPELSLDDDGAMRTALAAIERRSLTQCEQCGAPGSLMARRHWYRTLCLSCAAADGFEPLDTAK